MKVTRGSETSQYPEEKKSSEIPLVAASEGGEAQTNPTTNRLKVQCSMLKRKTNNLLTLNSER